MQAPEERARSRGVCWRHAAPLRGDCRRAGQWRNWPGKVAEMGNEQGVRASPVLSASSEPEAGQVQLQTDEATPTNPRSAGARIDGSTLPSMQARAAFERRQTPVRFAPGIRRARAIIVSMLSSFFRFTLKSVSACARSLSVCRFWLITMSGPCSATKMAKSRLKKRVRIAVRTGRRGCAACSRSSKPA